MGLQPDSFDINDLLRQARAFAAQGQAASTRKAYAADWGHFENWCHAGNWPALPAAYEVVALYLTALTREGKKLNTLTRRLAAIAYTHRQAALPSPTNTPVVEAVLTGIRRTYGSRPHGVAALLTDDIRAMVRTLPDSLLGIRDRAVILLGYAVAFRRSELVQLDVTDLAPRVEGLAVTLRRSKTDQEGHGRLVGIPFGTYPDTCPVQAVLFWLEAAQITAGAVFRGMNRHGPCISTRLSGRAVATIIKRAAAAAGLDSTQYTPHSLRAGYCTTAARAGVEERVLMQQTGHTCVATLRRYVRAGSLFLENSAVALGLYRLVL